MPPLPPTPAMLSNEIRAKQMHRDIRVSQGIRAAQVVALLLIATALWRH